MIASSHHAIESLCLFYPRADEATVEAEVSRGVFVEPAIAVRIVGRQNARRGSAYVLHRERTGLFVVAPDGTVITFLRFYALAQHELARTLYGDGEAPTCIARWNVAKKTLAELQVAEAAAREARKAQERAEAKAKKQAERQAQGVAQAANYLRKRGWTCIPPEGGEEAP